MSLLAWFPLNGHTLNKGLLGADVQPTAQSVQYVDGLLGKCLSTGSLTLSAAQTAKLFHKTTSIAFWLYPISGSGSTTILGTSGMTPPNNRKFTLFQYPDYKTLHWSWQDDNSDNTYAGGTTALIENQWNHIAVVQDELHNQVKIFVNGENRATDVPNPSIASRNITYHNATTLLHNTTLNKICDLRIYDHALQPREIKELAKGLLVHYTFDDVPTGASYISDSSGYNHNASISNRCVSTSECAQGISALRTYGNTAGSTLAASSFIKGDIGTTITPSAFTISFAAKLNDWGVQTSGMLSLSNFSSTPTDYQDSLISQYDSRFQLNASGSTTNAALSTNVITKGEWHHYAFRWNGTNWESFKDGVLYQTVSASFTPDPFRYIYLGLNAAGGAYRDADVTWGEFKLYMTALSDTEILKEAQFTQRLLANGHSHVVAVKEANVDRSCVSFAGVNTINGIAEILELEDGSCWIQLSHHNNRSKVHRFSSTDDFANKFVYHNSDCWSAFHLVSSHGLYNNQYEFMAVENINTTDNIAVRRWVQKVSPLTATYADVKPGSSNVVYNTNYDVPSINGGMYKLNSNTFFCITNATNGNWFGAFGAWNWHGDGIPTFENRSTSGILDLYMRINPEDVIYREFKGGIVAPVELNEI